MGVIDALMELQLAVDGKALEHPDVARVRTGQDRDARLGQFSDGSPAVVSGALLTLEPAGMRLDKRGL